MASQLLREHRAQARSLPPRLPPPARVAVQPSAAPATPRIGSFELVPAGAEGGTDLACSVVMRIFPGLSSFAADHVRARESLRPLIEFASEKVVGAGRPPAEQELRLMASTGLRLLKEHAQEAIDNESANSNREALSAYLIELLEPFF